MVMDRVRATLNKALGEKAASDFINFALSMENVEDIKKRVCALLDTRKPENRQVYEILMREKQRRTAFPQTGYRKTKTDPNAPFEITNFPTEENTTTERTQENTKSDGSGPKKKQKPKFYPLFSEGARGDQLVSLLPGRHPCQCLATKHQLVNNCTSCGRIVCAQEGSGPCFFCGHLVCTKAEHDTIALGTKQAIKLKNRLMQAPWAPGTQTPPYRRKSRSKYANPSEVTTTVSDDDGDDEDNDEEEWDPTQLLSKNDDAQQRLEAGLAAALVNRDRLLEYDATSARRTRVLDDEMDYFVSEGSGGAAAWLSPEARERVAKRLAELRALRHASRLQTTRLCLDFAGRSVELVDTRDEAARQLYRPTEKELEQLQETVRSQEPNNSQDHTASEVSSGRMIDPTLNEQLFQFLPTLTTKQISMEHTSNSGLLMKALSNAQNENRVQDDTSRQLTDEGYCLSLHQPWASFLVRGIKKDEGRVWYSAHRGCLWIAATSKKPDPDTVQEMEQNYLKSGGSRTNLPQSYPTGCLLGRVNVVDILNQDEYRSRFPDGPSDSPYVFICDDPRELLLKLPITGKHKIYKLEKHIHAAAIKNLAL